MKIAILNYSIYGNSADEVSNDFICEAAKEMGHHCFIVHIPSIGWPCDKTIRSTGLLSDIECIIPRFDVRSASELEWILSIIEWAEDKGYCSLVSSSEVRNAEDKGRTALILAKNNLSAPKTIILGFSASIGLNLIEQQINALGGYPIVIKHPYGWGGIGVVKIESSDGLRSTLDLISQLGYKGVLLLQEYIYHNATISVAVVDGKIIRSSAKTPGKDFRSNIRAGGSETDETLSPPEEKLALNVAKAFEIDACTIDFARSSKGTVVFEVNACPGLYYTQDMKVARAMISLLEHKMLKKDTQESSSKLLPNSRLLTK